MNSTAIPPKKLALSYTSAKLFEECPARFYAERVKGIKQPNTPALALGNFVHEVCDRYVKHLVKVNKASDYAEIDKIAAALWAERSRKKDWAILREDQKGEMLELVQGLREGLTVDPEDVVGSELELAFNEKWERVEWLAEDVAFRAKIDLLVLRKDGVALVWDLKTGRRIEPIKGNLQTPIYAMAVNLILPDVSQFRAELFYARNGKLNGADLGMQDVAAAREWVEGIRGRVKDCASRGTWVETPGVGCQNCPVRSDCAAIKGKSPATMAGTIDEAENLLAKLIVLEEEADSIKEKLKAFVTENGPIEVNGVVADFEVSETASFDTVALVGVLTKAGLESMKFLKSDNTALKKASAKDKGLAAALKAIAEVKQKTAFKIKRATKDAPVD